MAVQPVPGPLTPEPVAYVRDLLSGFGATWSLCGGWAVDAWLGGQTRSHGDVDIKIFHDDQRALFEHLSDWLLVGHDPNVPDDTTQPWTGRWLDRPAHVHVPTPTGPLATSTTRRRSRFEFEFLLDERAGDDWILRREPNIVLPVGRLSEHSAWGLPTAAPESVLFFKAGGLNADEIDAEHGTLRPRDEQDFHALLPALTRTQRHWLRDALACVHPRHPWLARITP